MVGGESSLASGGGKPIPIASSPASVKLVSVTEPREPTNARVPLVIRIGGTADSTNL